MATSKKKSSKSTTTTTTTTVKKVVKNPRTQQVADPHEVHGLMLVLDNDEPSYRQWQAIVKNLWRHKAKGRYDSERAVDGFMHLTNRQKGYSTAVRRAAAKEYRDSFENNWRDESYYKPVTNPSRQYSDIENWPYFVLDGVIESNGYPDDTPNDITPELREVIEKYESRLAGTLGEIVAKHPPKAGQDFDDVWEADAVYYVFMTLNGESVGIWDGRWDHLWDKNDLEIVQRELKHRLRDVADDTGGGWLNDAFENAAYENARMHGDDDAEHNPSASTRAHALADRLARGLS